jgi:acyl-CoA synthetase (AMP-forming)/AMP-acid ligase II
MSYNLPEYDEIAKALDYLQVGMVMIGYRMKPPEIQFIVENSDSRVFFFWHEFSDRILPFRDSFRSLIGDGFVVFGGPAEGARSYEELFGAPPELDFEKLTTSGVKGQSMIYTSGTTGKPKGAARSTDFASRPEVAGYVMRAIQFLKMSPEEVPGLLPALPLGAFLFNLPDFFSAPPSIAGASIRLPSRRWIGT